MEEYTLIHTYMLNYIRYIHTYIYTRLHIHIIHTYKYIHKHTNAHVHTLIHTFPRYIYIYYTHIFIQTFFFHTKLEYTSFSPALKMCLYLPDLLDLLFSPVDPIVVSSVVSNKVASASKIHSSNAPSFYI